LEFTEKGRKLSKSSLFSLSFFVEFCEREREREKFVKEENKFLKKLSLTFSLYLSSQKYTNKDKERESSLKAYTLL
jgi:hypothetical protein